MIAEGSIQPLAQPSVSDLLTTIGDSAIQMVGAERVAVLLLGDSNSEWMTLAPWAFDDGSESSSGTDADWSAAEQAVAANEGIVLSQPDEHDNFARRQGPNETQPLSTMCALLRRGGLVVGVILAQSQHRIFDGDDLNGLQALANLAATVIENQSLSEEAQEAKKARAEFVSLVTHQLRVPLTSIKGYTDLMLSGRIGSLNEQQSNFLGTIRRNADRMNILIRDLGAINRIESDRMQFEFSQFSIGDALDEAVGSLRDSVEHHGQKLVIEATSDLPAVYADRHWVNHILANLLDNAIQYTPEGGEITVTTVKLDDLVEIEVVDTGIGISEADQACLFTQFFRSEDSAVRQVAGWGLGLALSKRLAEAMGGQIGCQSVLGNGSTFAFSIPLAE